MVGTANLVNHVDFSISPERIQTLANSIRRETITIVSKMHLTERKRIILGGKAGEKRSETKRSVVGKKAKSTCYLKHE